MSEILTLLTKKPEVASAVAALLAVFVSALSVMLTVWALALQRRHSYLSVRPLAFVASGDYQDRLSVKIRNDGIGPLIIKKLCVTDGETVKDCLIDWLPLLPEGILWDTFTKNMEDRSLAPGGEIVLFRLSNRSYAQFHRFRDLCRTHLKKLTVEVHYVDIYDRKMPVSYRSLAWFGHTRSLDVSKADEDLKASGGPVDLLIAAGE